MCYKDNTDFTPLYDKISAFEWAGKESKKHEHRYF